MYYSTGQEHSLGLGSRASSFSPVVGDRRHRCKAGMLKFPWPSGLGNWEQQGNRAPERPDNPLKHPLAVTMGWPCAAGGCRQVGAGLAIPQTLTAHVPTGEDGA